MKRKLLTLGAITTLTVPSVIAISCSEEQLPTLKSQSFGYVLNNPEEVVSLLLHNSNSGRVGAAFLDINKVEGNVPTTGQIWTKTYNLIDGQSNSMNKKDYLLELLADDNAAIAAFLHNRLTTTYPGVEWNNYTEGLKYNLSINQENQSFTFSIYEYPYVFAIVPVTQPTSDQTSGTGNSQTANQPTGPEVVQPAVQKNELEKFADDFVSTMEKNTTTVAAEGYQFFKGVAIFDFAKFQSRYHMDANYHSISEFNTVIENATGAAPVEKTTSGAILGTKYLAFGENHDITIIFHPVLDIANERFSVKLEFNKGGTVKIGSDDSIQGHDPNFETVFKTVFIPDAFPSSTTQLDFTTNQSEYRNALTETQQWIFKSKGSLSSFCGQEPMLAPYITEVQGATEHFTSEVASDPEFIESSFNASCLSSKIDMQAFLLNADNTRGHGLNFGITSGGPNNMLAILESVMFVYVNQDLIESTYSRLHTTP